MSNSNFKKWNTILGWCVFIIALITYTLTAEPTVSFWDCGEYILTSSKLEVGHPPGAPLFQMIGAFFSIFAFGNSENIGFTLNMMSVISSAFTILLMFWSITLLLKKILSVDSELPNDKALAILSSSLVGSLAYTFTDSFWFNAVETEVYAMATLIMAALFWLALKWDQDMNTPRGHKWLLLMAYIIGLSFGVHFMGLLTIPAIGLIYYFKNYKTITLKNFIIANIVSVAVLLFVFKLLAPNILRIFSDFEIFFVNTIGLPFNSGTIIAGVFIIALIYFGLKYTYKKNYVHLNTCILCVTFIIIGFSTWLMLPIRANANVVVNENNPSDARELLAYYNLEQYPETHLFYGPLFTDQYAYLDEKKPYIDDKPNYEKNKAQGKYVIINDYKDAKQNFNSNQASVLPRMWSPEHAENYMKYFTGYLNFTIKPEYQSSKELREAIDQFRTRLNSGRLDYADFNSFLNRFKSYIDIEKPSLIDNIKYLFQYQIGYMYWRYFMWNFSGRQDDFQGKYNNNGNWITGITPIDNILLGLPQTHLPSDVLTNKARNTYYLLPFILGLIGFFFLLNRDKKIFWTMLVLFLFTGIAIQVYTNVRPFEPRERDYSVIGSFYVFAMWIGFGVFALFATLKKYISSSFLVPTIALVCLILVPGIMAANNWDDHDRSQKYTANTMAKSYLDSCAKNAILFTIGDNDTFALWYVQEIEGYRTDVRVINTSLFQTDWYIDQMKRKAYDSDPIPSQLTHDKYKYGTNDYVIIEEILKDTLQVKQFLDIIQSDSPKTKYRFVLEKNDVDLTKVRRQDLESSYLPTRDLRFPVNKENVLASGIVKPKDADLILPYIDLHVTGNALYKNRLLMLDIIANNDWKRPIYFTGGSFGDDDYIWMKDYLQLDGMCYKLVPIKTPIDKNNPFDMGRIDTDFMYNLVKKWEWGNSGKGIYLDPESRRNSISYRGNLSRLNEALIKEKKLKEAEEIADIAMTNMPVDQFGYYTLLQPYISTYYLVGNKEKAEKLFLEIASKYQENLTYYSLLTVDKQNLIFEDIYTDIERYKSFLDVISQFDTKFANEQAEIFNNYLRLFKNFYDHDSDELDNHSEGAEGHNVDEPDNHSGSPIDSSNK